MPPRLEDSGNFGHHSVDWAGFCPRICERINGIIDFRSDSAILEVFIVEIRNSFWNVSFPPSEFDNIDHRIFSKRRRRRKKEVKNSFSIESLLRHLFFLSSSSSSFWKYSIEIFAPSLDSFPVERRRHFPAGSNLISLENAQQIPCRRRRLNGTSGLFHAAGKPEVRVGDRPVSLMGRVDGDPVLSRSIFRKKGEEETEWNEIDGAFPLCVCEGRIIRTEELLSLHDT